MENKKTTELLDLFKTLSEEKGDYVTGGKYEGVVSIIGELDKKNKRVWIEVKGERKEVPINLVTVVGKDKPVLKLE